MLSPEDKKDVSRTLGKKAANVVAKTTDDKYQAKTKALVAKMNKMFSGGPSKQTLRQLKAQKEQTGFYAPGAAEKREAERMAHKEKVRKYHADREAGLNPKNPYL